MYNDISWLDHLLWDGDVHCNAVVWCGWYECHAGEFMIRFKCAHSLELRNDGRLISLMVSRKQKYV